jgi:hypothetical protein
VYSYRLDVAQLDISDLTNVDRMYAEDEVQVGIRDPRSIGARWRELGDVEKRASGVALESTLREPVKGE